MTTLLTSELALEEQKLIACVHCGLCLESCPTYVLTGDENDSPRGRIYLMRAVAEGKLAGTSSSFQKHIDRCLGCRACEPVCPAGVEYGQLLEGARELLLDTGKRGGLDYGLLRLVLRKVWLQPARLRLAFLLARWFRDLRIAKLLLMSRLPGLVSKRLEMGLALLESSRSQLFDRVGRSNLSGNNTATTLLFKGCVTEGLFQRTNEASARVLIANGFAVEAPSNQVCCGALHAHAGDLDGARVLARRNIEAFESSSAASIVTNAGGCGAMLLTYGHLLANDAEYSDRASLFSKRIVDISQKLSTCDLKKGGKIPPQKITYDASCHLINGQRAVDAPLQMLKAIPELDYVPLKGADRCCGGAGIYNLLEPAMSQGVLDEKLTCLKDTGAQVLATGNPGCQMQIGAGARLAGMDLKVCHPVELLDESYRQAGMYK